MLASLSHCAEPTITSRLDRKGKMICLDLLTNGKIRANDSRRCLSIIIAFHFTLSAVAAVNILDEEIRRLGGRRQHNMINRENRKCSVRTTAALADFVKNCVIVARVSPASFSMEMSSSKRITCTKMKI